ncbi:MAG: sodium/hydrogen exchanger [Planctomycetota bacterium]|nr:MAG: sodium/hydrogen exchanger [Planctomycetota bacterium]
MEHGVELAIVFIICFTLAAGALARVVAPRLGLPYTIAMLVLGLGVGLGIQALGADGGPLGQFARYLARGSELEKDLIVFVFLPALIFESAFALEVHAFRMNLGPVAVLAGPVLLASTFAIGALAVGLSSLCGWSWGWGAALVFGALMSATDPVAVVGLLRELGAPKRLGVLIEGESLLNDGTAIVAFTVLLGLATGTTDGISWLGALGEFAWVVTGGVAVGLGLAAAVSAWLSRTFNDPLLEISLTVVLAYLAMVLAEGMAHVSGVMAVVTAGLWLAGPGRTHISPEVSHFLHRFWEMLSYVANTLIFFLVGLVIATQLHEASPLELVVVLAIFCGLVAIRFALVFGALPLMNRTGAPIGPAEASVIAWGGLRGAVSLALALWASTALGPPLGRQILFATAGAVLLTILVNGSSMAALLRRLGFDRPPAGERLAVLAAHEAVLQHVGQQIQRVSGARDLRAVDWRSVEQELAERQRELARELAHTRQELDRAPPAERRRGYWRQVLNMERQAYWSAFAEGTLSAWAARILDHEIDLQLDRLERGDDSPPARRSPELTGLRAGLARRLERPGRRLGRLGFAVLELRYDLARGESLAAEQVLAGLEELEDIDPEVRAQARRTYRRYLRAAKEQLEDLRVHLPEVTQAIETRLARRIQLNFERDKLEELERRGAMDHAAAAEALAAVERRMKALRFSARSVELPETAELVRSAPLFRELDDAAIAALAVLTAERVFAPGEVLVREGERGESMFVIARGACLVVLERGGEEEVLDVLGGGDIVGEMALLTGAPRTATVRAATTVTAGEIARADFHRLLAEQPALRRGVWQTFARRQFDNHLRQLARWRHLGHDERLGWFARGELRELAAAEPVEAGAGFVFVVTGALARDGQRHEAPALLARAGAGSLVAAAAETRVVLLPPPEAEPAAGEG